MKTTTDVIIVGAGIVGASMALSLAQRGISVTLIERGDPSATIPKTLKAGHTAALMENSLDVLYSLGIDNDLAPWAADLNILRIMDVTAEPFTSVDFNASEIGQDRFGCNIPNVVMLAALIKKAKQTKEIDYKPKTEIEVIDTQNNVVTVSLKGQKKVTAPLLIAADGKRSFCRKQASIDADITDYNQTAMTFLVQHDKPHGNASTEIHKGYGPLTFVPMRDPHESAIVWADLTPKVEEHLRLKKQDLEELLRAQSKDFLGSCKITTEIGSWPLYGVKAKAYTAPRMALIGEAAHAMSPIGAQGLNLSLRDVKTLADLIVQHKNLGLEIGSKTVLDRYARDRAWDIGSKTFAVDNLNRAVKRENPFVNKLRRTALKTLNTVTPLKHFVMSQGMAAK